MDVPELIEQLSRPSFYPDPTSRVEVVQTHISTVFLTDRYVYKVKKPVDFGFLDYTTLEKRRAMCDKEVALNARLCPDVYVGTVAITRSGDRLSLDGDGEVVEHAVKMVRLPEERMLRQVLARGEVAPAIFVRIAEVLADFHARAETSSVIADMKRLDGVKFNCDENFQQTEPYIDRLLTRQRFDLIRTSTDLFFARHRALFERRADEGRVRDGHGDLHLDSICVTDPVSIFDCIEFNERFRYQDVAEEVAFLAMDLEFHGHPDLAGAFVDAYVRSSGDRELLRLLDFYKAYRAYVRAKINSFQLDDPNVPAERREAIEETARRYYELAERYACAFNPRRLFVTCGLTGSGKSTLARKLAEMYGVEVLRSDRVRKELLGLQPEERRHVPYGVGEYAPSMTGQTYAAMAERAETLLAVGRSVVLDGCFIKREQRAEALAVARRLAVPIVLLECRASEEVVRQRLERRVAKTGSVSDGRWEIYCTQVKEFEPPDEFPPADRIVLDRSRPIEELTGILAGLGPPEWRGEPRD